MERQEYTLTSAELKALKLLPKLAQVLTKNTYEDMILSTWQMIGEHHDFDFKTVEHLMDFTITAVPLSCSAIPL